jgi:hypothetical protein
VRKEEQETEEETVAVLELFDDKQANESSCGAAEFFEEEQSESQDPRFRKIEGSFEKIQSGVNCLEQLDASGAKGTGMKQSFKRVLLLPFQMISVLAFGIGFCFAYLLFGDQEEENES